MKKYISITFLILFVTVFFSCEEDFDLIDPSTIPVSEFIVDAETAEAALMKAYDDMQSQYFEAIEPKATTGLYADEFDHTGSFPHYTEYLVNNLLTENIGLERIYSYHYDAINTTTEVIRITSALSSDAISDADKEAVVAEAHAIRAYAYFKIVQLFGGLPITELTVPLDGDGANNTSRSTEAEVYAYINSEIALAEGKIIDNGVNRFSNNALLALKAKVQMLQENFSGARTTLESLIGQYSLAPTYSQLFNTSSNSEAIMRLNYTAADSNSLAFYFLPAGRYEIGPSQTLLNAFESGDVRINLINTSGTNPYIMKYSDTATGTDSPYLFRYADIVLMYAEVLARANDPAAVTYLNMVRTRAGLPGVTSLDSSNFVSLIAQERFVEFFAEGHRWYDIKRLGLAPSIIGAKTGITFLPKMLLWPIPQAEFDANDSMDQSDQNPGY